MRLLDAEAVASLGPRAAVQAVTDALRTGLDPVDDPARSVVGLATGHFLLMPAQSPTGAGVKVATVAPNNPGRGLPRIQGTYLLFDRDTLTLRAALDGTALTAVRTPAVSVAAVLPRLPDRPLRVAVVGHGPQARAHLATLAAVRPVQDGAYLVRDPTRSSVPALALSSAHAERVLRAADVVVCATSARAPVLDADAVRDDATVIAVGSHEPDARELDAGLLTRATVVVEDVATALREAGDVVLAVEQGSLRPDDLVPMREVVTGRVDVPEDRPLVFKSVGMAWQDLVVAEAVLRAADG